MPDYEIRCWDGNSFDFDSVPFVREAMSVKQYAAASDYVRLYALYTEGGIYLDSDVMVYKPFDDLLDNRYFCGTESF
jgi:mannosyltransferase OCH1-like enzyme